MSNNLVVCGGTFDHFHKGHRSLLKLAFSLGQKVVIGVTSDQYVKKLKNKNEKLKIVEEFEKRKEAILEFVTEEGVLEKVETLRLDDIFGPTLNKNLAIDAIIVSKDTKKGAEYINRKRKKMHLSPLKVFITPAVYAEDGKLVSSGRIRSGEINREGKLYVNPLWLKKDLMLPENLREKFKKPFGKLLKDTKGFLRNINNLVITVGDVTTKNFNGKSLGQNISVIDFKVAREKKFSNILELGCTGQEKVFNAGNPAGFITSDLFKKIAEIFKTGIKNKTILQVNGEEDLSVLPLVLLSPLNTIIYYGQPGRGLVRLVVSEEIKRIVYGLVDGFEIQY